MLFVGSGSCLEGGRRRTQNEPDGGPMTGQGWNQRETGGNGGRSYGKIKSHLTCGGSHRGVGRSHEARPFWGTSWFHNRRRARSVSPRVPPDTRTGSRRRADRGRIANHDPWPRPTRESPHECAARAVPPPRKLQFGRRRWRLRPSQGGSVPARLRLPRNRAHT